MPIGPISQQPINRIDDLPAVTHGPQMESSQPQTVGPQSEPPTPVKIATQLVQNARAGRTSGSDPSIAPPLGDLVDALSSQMGEELPAEQRQKLASQLADDPVVKGLIG